MKLLQKNLTVDVNKEAEGTRQLAFSWTVNFRSCILS